MSRFDHQQVRAYETRRGASTGGGAIRASAPEGLGVRAQHRALHCSAVAGMSSIETMT